MPFVGSSNAEIHYTIIGEGPPILFLHGIFGAGSDWIEAGFHLSLPQNKLILLDLRGHGQSTKLYNPDRYLPLEHSQDILAVLNNEGINKVTLWGYSFGGRMVFAFAIAYPERVKQVIVGGMHPFSVDNVHSNIRQRQSVIAKGMKEWVKYLEEKKIPISEYTRSILLKNDHEALVAMDSSILSWKGFHNINLLCNAKIPIVIYIGSRDQSYLSLARKYTDSCDFSDLVVIENLNHFTAFSNSMYVVNTLKSHIL